MRKRQKPSALQRPSQQVSQRSPPRPSLPALNSPPTNVVPCMPEYPSPPSIPSQPMPNALVPIARTQLVTSYRKVFDYKSFTTEIEVQEIELDKEERTREYRNASIKGNTSKERLLWKQSLPSSCRCCSKVKGPACRKQPRCL